MAVDLSNALALLGANNNGNFLGVDPGTQAQFDALKHKAMMQSIFPALLALGGGMLTSPRMMGQTGAIGTGLLAGGSAYENAYKSDLNDQLQLASLAQAKRQQYLSNLFKYATTDATVRRANAAEKTANLKFESAQASKDFGKYLIDRANASPKMDPTLKQAYLDMGNGLMQGLAPSAIGAFARIPGDLLNQEYGQFRNTTLAPLQAANARQGLANKQLEAQKTGMEIQGTLPSRPKAPETDIQTAQRRLKNHSELLHQWMLMNRVNVAIDPNAPPEVQEAQMMAALTANGKKPFDKEGFQKFVVDSGYDPATYEARSIEEAHPFKGATIVPGEPPAAPRADLAMTHAGRKLAHIEAKATPAAIHATLGANPKASQVVAYLTSLGMSRDDAISWLKANASAF